MQELQTAEVEQALVDAMQQFDAAIAHCAGRSRHPRRAGQDRGGSIAEVSPGRAIEAARTGPDMQAT